MHSLVRLYQGTWQSNWIGVIEERIPPSHNEVKLSGGWMPDVIREGKRPPLMQQRSRKRLRSFLLRVLHEPHVGVITYIMSLSRQAVVLYQTWSWCLNLEPLCCFFFFSVHQLCVVLKTHLGPIIWICGISVHFSRGSSSHWPNKVYSFLVLLPWSLQAAAALWPFQGSRSALQPGHSFFPLLQHQHLQQKGNLWRVKPIDGDGVEPSRKQSACSRIGDSTGMCQWGMHSNTGAAVPALSCCTLDCPACMCLRSHLHCSFPWLAPRRVSDATRVDPKYTGKPGFVARVHVAPRLYVLSPLCFTRNTADKALMR